MFSGTNLLDDARNDLVRALSKLSMAALLIDRNARPDRRQERDYHPWGFPTWMAGGGVKGRNIHATILRLMGMDDTRLMDFYQGRDQRFTDVHGQGEFTDLLLRG